ncbi:hypothetical protein [Nostocoides sp. HKS02]|uniref:hypothetical protein n=1 Tax=Nostocoides sp. HKS02 TaxID=1813880 RepID=UPI001E4F2075|nr:hypothetical protein [Tetrasphaera sp. HKS02]
MFSDLESQWDAELRRSFDAEVADRTRRERATVGLGERLAAVRQQILRVSLSTGEVVEGRVADVGAGWLLLRTTTTGPGPGAALVPFVAVTAVVGLGRHATSLGVGRRFGFGYALRGLSRDRAVVSLTDRSGAVCTGTIDVVGADVLELSEHPADVPRRPENLTGSRLVPFASVVVVRQAASA